MNIKYKLEDPVTVNGKEVKEIELVFDKITGQKLLRIASTLPNASGVNSFTSPEALNAIAAEAAGMIPDDFSMLKAPDYLEIVAIVQHFLLGTLHLTKYSSTPNALERSPLN